MFIEMEVHSVTVDEESKAPVVMLKDKSGDRTMPIWIGLLEASSIATELEGIKLSRPLTHDLLVDMIDKMGGATERIEINDLKDNVYYSSVFIKKDSALVEVDSRPSDAIALSLRVGLDIYVDEDVLVKANKDINEAREKAAAEVRLEDIPSEGFSKYKM